MSNEVNDVTPQELNSQLRNYGQWLERRSDVALSPVDVDVVAGDDGDAELPGGPPVGPRLLAVAVAGIALLALAAIGLGAIGNSADTDNVATASADESELDIPTSNVDDPPAVATGRQEATPAPSAEATEEGADDDTAGEDTTDSTAAAAPAPTDDAANEADDAALVAEPEVFNDEALTPSTLVLEEGQTTVRPDEGAGASAPGFLFVSPRDGQALNLNANNSVESRLVVGAVSYTFEIWQNGAKAFEISTAERTFLIPNQMLTGNPMMSPGQVELRVTATDASGSVLATGQITVTMEGAATATPNVTTGPWPTNG